MSSSLSSPLALLLCTASFPALVAAQDAAYPGRDDRLPGHSARGHAFDDGPREKPWKMLGIGAAHFPITTSVPEVQQWFDQGITLLHSFWYYEAERAFRWCIELDPECAMAYWGMALAVEGDHERFEELLAQALRRKDAVSERERLYIEAWVGAEAPRLEGRFAPRTSSTDRPQRNALQEKLEKLVVRFPDDVEAKAFTLLAGMGEGGRIAGDALVKDILAVAPDHPGAHHYRIHLWDSSEENGVALESCNRYGRIAWDVGHANHMPGHVYSGLGMWREAAIWMESATRIELRQMQERMLFPYDYWNFAHNRNYLAYIQEQQGLVEPALLGARTLLATPANPAKDEEEDGKKGEYDDYVHSEGLSALVRCLLKFERWDEVLRKDAIPWKENDDGHAAWRAYAEALAHLGRGEVPEAIESATDLREKVDETKDDWDKRAGERWFREVDALVRLHTDRELEGLSELEELAREQAEDFRRRDDPPDDRAVFYTLLGELHRERGSPKLAAECFEKSLELVRNDGFALSGLARAEHALGNREAATRAWGRLEYVWAKAEPKLRWWDAAKALGLESAPIDESPAKQRDYDSAALAELGPLEWAPFPAPKLVALDPAGKTVGLEELRGHNVVLVFYLGGQCVACVKELAALAKKTDDFAELDATIIGVSADAPADLAKPEALKDAKVRLLSDADHASARAFHAWDDFDDQAVHATLLIDRQGRVRWKHVGSEPFADADLLLDELRRWGSEPAVAAKSGSGVQGSF